jgi:hypothetical protein
METNLGNVFQGSLDQSLKQTFVQDGEQKCLMIDEKILLLLNS